MTKFSLAAPHQACLYSLPTAVFAQPQCMQVGQRMFPARAGRRLQPDPQQLFGLLFGDELHPRGAPRECLRLPLPLRCALRAWVFVWVQQYAARVAAQSASCKLRRCLPLKACCPHPLTAAPSCLSVQGLLTMNGTRSAGVTADLGQTIWSNLTLQGLKDQQAQAIVLIGDLAYAVSPCACRAWLQCRRHAAGCS